ncbi:hypothetical protein AMAG_08426 [Allomyces macrogynus ATCC 38327]|uniref:Erythromycin biosynthesis protein CIII-like C-terminal domain-containing protein n=1 Tax=Allomyces macrogynus (strain ATCC 38327) TaxID=578462 RepID=A0A0L0SLN0_ALLM3|nr:hypothetical protein AMAG_08426 [Allomyces macrogynus ATCC 38327]|eukprot:KNE63285.1 hypothetical protein AMAG_08426 [Allomyces macrogynus ATCC 38327]
MRILIVAFGSRGDIQPALAAAHALRSAAPEHPTWTHSTPIKIAIATQSDLQAWVERDQFSYIPLAGTALGTFGSPRAMRAFVNNDFTDSDALFGRSEFTDIATQLVAVASSFDVVLLVGYLLAHHAVVLRRVVPPTTVVGVLEMFLTTYPTRAFPPAIPVLPAIPNLAGWINAALHHFNNFMGYKVQWGPLTDRLCTAAGVAPVAPRAVYESLAALPHFYAISPTLLPVPDDFPTHARMQAALSIPKDAAEPLDPALDAWLDAGTMPVYVGFGVVTVDAFDLVALVRDLLAHVPSSTRVVVFAGGYSATDAIPFPRQVAALQALDSDRVFVISTTAPHALLFPRCKAIVHHAGAGTIAAAVRAGVPQVPVPVAIDQPFWAQRVFELGVAARPVPFAKRSGARIAAGIKEVREEGMVKRAREVAEMLRREPEGAGVLATWVAGLVSAARASAMEGGVEGGVEKDA